MTEPLAGRRVLAGQICRAVGERLHAVIMMTDMRGFTAIFGNVGAADRLDSTMIGLAVNHASRIEDLTKQLLRPVLVSRAFARACPRPLVPSASIPCYGPAAASGP